MENGSKDRYFQSTTTDVKKLVPEGIAARVPIGRNAPTKAKSFRFFFVIESRLDLLVLIYSFLIIPCFLFLDY